MEAAPPMARPAILARSPSLNSFPELPASSLAAAPTLAAGNSPAAGRIGGTAPRFVPGNAVAPGGLTGAAGLAELIAAAGGLPAPLGRTALGPHRAACAIPRAASAT